MGSIANADRRDPIALRRPFHATIGLGALDASDAINADAIDLSVSGMSVRTDMLPDVGVQMEFRFMLEDGKPIDARGEVVWTHDEGSRAGAFGVKFLAMPGDARASLRRSLEPVSKSPAAVGDSKVRLHLESMDAPFRAKLRERQPGSVVVGHELSFLKLGGKVTVEGAKDNEPGVISAVDVEIDPVTQNPRLILTIDLDNGASARALRVTSVAKAPVTAALIDAARVSLPPVEAPAEPVAAKAEPVAAPVREPERAVDTARSEPEPARAKPTTVVQPVVAPPSAIDSSEDDFDDDAPAGPSLMERGVSAARGAWEGTRRIVTPVAAGVVGGVAALRARFQRPADMDDLDAPRSGLRPQHSPALATTSDPDGMLARKRNRRVVMYAGAAAVLTVLIIAMAISGGPSATTPHPQVAVTTDPAPAAEVVAPAPVAVTDLPAEDPVPMGAEARVIAAGNSNLPADLQGAAISPAGQVEGARAVVMQRRVRPAGFVPAVTPARAMAVTATPGRGAAMGNPSVRVGTRLALRMDGPIASITGAGTRGNTISMVIPGRRSLDLAASLVRMDARILNAGVMNRAAGAELTLRFRDAAPPFFAHARGNTLEVILGAAPGAARRPAPAAPVLRVSRR
ncbi:MAG: PilZ domain-containing protein [Deltaproteobacteria bacterium]|nr:PilZ domain-containing protein [Myxococcales bacterium]MDP3216242.1 PilZ domain-containing protein [Deltaproteobacteria bacterium]